MKKLNIIDLTPVVINNQEWLSTKQASIYSENYLRVHRGIENKGYTEWRLRQLANESLDNPSTAKLTAMKVPGTRVWLIEKTSFEKFLREIASPHSPHTSYDKTLSDGRKIRIESR